jgi:hypothetical protein
VLLKSVTLGSPVKITAATVTLTNTDFMDITAAGVASPFTGTSMGNCLGNTNITFDTPATQTHTASAGGNWSDATKWTSRVPLPQDNVVVDVNTTGTLTADMPRLGADIAFSGFAGTASFASTPNTSYGSWVSGSGMTLSGTQNLNLQGRSSHTITCNGINFTQWIQVFGNGTYTLADAFLASGNGALSTSLLGTLNTNNFNMTLPWLACLGTTVLGTSTVNVYLATQSFYAAAGVMSAASAAIVFSVATVNNRLFAGGGNTYGTLTYTVAGSTGALVITGANTFSTINFSDVTNARTLTLPASTTTTITSAFNVNGTSGKLMTINSSSAGTRATLSKASGVVSCDYLSIFDSTATGGASWLAGANSISN